MSIKECDIRPDEMVEVMLKLHDQDIADIMKYKNGFIEVTCPACESNKNEFMFEKEGFTFVGCKECETIFINPRPTSNMLSDFYANGRSMKYWNDNIFPVSEDRRKTSIFAPRAKRVAQLCRKYNSDFKTLVDVGAGYGTFCEEMKRLGVFNEVIAVEPSTALAKTCENKGIKTIDKPIEEVKLDKVSVITNFEVIEHLFDPSRFIAACANALPKDGLLIITTPNIKGFELSMLMTLSPNIGGPDHLNYYFPDSIKFLLEKYGFEVLEITTPGELDAELVRKKVISKEMDLSGFPFLYDLLINKWDTAGANFQRFLAENGLSTHMWTVAIKK